MDVRRDRLRWRGYDYTTPGSYYVTLCTQGRRCLFGHVAEGLLHANDAGRMVTSVWESIPQTFESVRLAEFVLMPNHLHGLLTLRREEALPRVKLGTVIQWFKYRTTLEYGRGVRTRGWQRFERHLWQRGFHDRVLRDEAERAHASGYILRNPRQWREDRYHPDAP